MFYVYTIFRKTILSSLFCKYLGVTIHLDKCELVWHESLVQLFIRKFLVAQLNVSDGKLISSKENICFSKCRTILTWIVTNCHKTPW